MTGPGSRPCVLAIETATASSSVALVTRGGAIVSRTAEALHAESVVPAVHELVSEANISLHELDAVAVDVGPGLFTGLRVGIATARALGQALGIGLVPVVSLDVLAASVRGVGAGVPLLVAIDARRSEVFACVYEPDSESPEATPRRRTEPVLLAPQATPRRRTEPVLLAPQALSALVDDLAAGGSSDSVAVGVAGSDAPEPAGAAVARVAGSDAPEPAGAAVARVAGTDATGPDGAISLRVAGDGAWRYLQEAAGVEFLDVRHPSADVLGALAVGEIEAGRAVRYDEVLPVYLRDADIRINWETRVKAE